MKTFLLCGALIAVAAPAAAEVRPTRADPEVFETLVNYADLDLGRPAGADVMIARVRRAAREVCGQAIFSPRLEVRRHRTCVREAMNGAFMRLDAPLVTARFFRTGSPAELAAR